MFIGSNSSNFTATSELFLSNPTIEYWRFEVVYTLPSGSSSSSVSFLINQAPRNGTCSIAPLNGTTSTVFTVSCPNWVDSDGIQDYTIYGEDQTMIAFSSVPTMQVRLPAWTQANTSVLQLSVVIRDAMDCVAGGNVLSVVVRTDSSAIDQFVSTVQASASTACAESPSSRPDAVQWQSECDWASAQLTLATIQRHQHASPADCCMIVSVEASEGYRMEAMFVPSFVLGGVSLSNVFVSLLGHAAQPPVRNNHTLTLKTSQPSSLFLFSP